MPKRVHPTRPWILAADDELDIRTVIAELLEDEGYEVMPVANGRRALDVLQETAAPPGLILLDVMMPVMDGIAFQSAQQELPSLKQVPVVVMSATLGGSAVPLTRAAAYLPKPLDIDLLLTLVAQFCAAGPPAR